MAFLKPSHEFLVRNVHGSPLSCRPPYYNRFRKPNVSLFGKLRRTERDKLRNTIRMRRQLGEAVPSRVRQWEHDGTAGCRQSLHADLGLNRSLVKLTALRYVLRLRTFLMPDLTPEQWARKNIDRMLEEAGWTS